VSTFFSFFFSFISLSLLISMSIPPTFQSSHSICFSFNFDPCFFYYNFLYQRTYKIGIVLFQLPSIVLSNIFDIHCFDCYFLFYFFHFLDLFCFINFEWLRILLHDFFYLSSME
jgi:hypothetical protein